MAQKLRYFDGSTFERNGFTFRVNIERDDSSEAPWDREDGHPSRHQPFLIYR